MNPDNGSDVICVGDRVVACKVSPPSDQPIGKTIWIGNPDEPLQGSIMRYDANKIFRAHRHKINPRTIEQTQEAFVVIRGALAVCLWDENKKYLGVLQAGPGDAIFVWDCYHEVIIDERDTLAYELKAGQFTSVEKDKEFLDGQA